MKIDASAEKLFPQALDFAQRLIRTPSMPGEEGGVARLVAEEMKLLGYDDVETDGAGNVIGTVRGGGGPVTMFNAHMDHVSPGDAKGWTRGGPFSAAIDGGMLYGRGASDVKGALALMVYAGAALRDAGMAPEGDLLVAAVVQEEVGGTGTRFLLARGRRPDVCVLGEPTDGQIRIGHRGRMAVWVTFRGKPGHASMPAKARNPNYDAARFLVKLEKAVAKLPRHPALGPSTIAPTLVSVDATSSNVIPGETKVFLDWRSTTETPAGAERWLKKNIGTGFAVDFPVKEYRTYTGFVESGVSTVQDGFVLDAGHPLARRAAAAVREVTGKPAKTGLWRFATDGRLTAAAGIPTIGYSPAEESQAHTFDERVSVEALRRGLRVYPRLVLPSAPASRSGRGR